MSKPIERHKFNLQIEELKKEEEVTEEIKEADNLLQVSKSCINQKQKDQKK